VKRRTSLRYGPHHAQVAELWRPRDVPGERPVVVLIHGGFWRQLYTKQLMHGLAKAVVAHGWVAYNIEYRRVGRLGSGGWPETFQDVAAAIDALRDVAGIDLGCVVTCGHSAGGHLALWAGSSRVTGIPVPQAHHRVPVRAAISLAGVVDLDAAARRNLGNGAVPALMGGGPQEFPDRYALGSPAALLPMGIPQYLLHGEADTTVPASLSADYVDLARARGDEAEYVPLPGAGHMDMIDPHGAAFSEVVARLDLNGPGSPPTGTR
jgi:acetyl esterase/lipase